MGTVGTVEVEVEVEAAIGTARIGAAAAAAAAGPPLENTERIPALRIPSSLRPTEAY